MNHSVVVAGWIDLAGLTVAVGGLIYLHLAPTGLSALRNPVSQYGITPYKAGYRVQTIGLAAAGAGASVGIASALSGDGVSIVVALLLVFASARAVISWVPMDDPSSPRTRTGHNHGLIAIVTFGAATLAALRLGQLLERSAFWQWLAPLSTTLGTCMALLVVGMIVTRRSPTLRRCFGLIERGLYVAIIGWLALLGFALICRS